LKEQEAKANAIDHNCIHEVAKSLKNDSVNLLVDAAWEVQKWRCRTLVLAGTEKQRMRMQLAPEFRPAFPLSDTMRKL
jgi:hypothetical protein